MQHVIMNLFILQASFSYTLDYFSTCIIVLIPSMEIPLIICLCFYSLWRRGNNHFDVHFRRIGPYFFCRKMEKTRSVREEMDGKVFISRQSRHLFPFINNMIKVLFFICTLIWRVDNYVSRQGKV